MEITVVRSNARLRLHCLMGAQTYTRDQIFQIRRTMGLPLKTLTNASQPEALTVSDPVIAFATHPKTARIFPPVPTGSGSQ
jgi:hypothetical protein